MTSSPLFTLVEKAARDNGFDIRETVTNGWTLFSSSHCALNIWIFIDIYSDIYVAISSSDVGEYVNQYGAIVEIEKPTGSQYVFKMADIKVLHSFLKRAYQLSKSLPNEPLQEFRKLTSKLPDKTEEERIVKQRIGQDIFRKSLFDYWDGQCAVTGFAIPQLLKASHIKPWADCEKDEDRLCVFNGLLLSPQYDAAFDNGLISFGNNGAIIISQMFPREEYTKIGIRDSIRITNIDQRHCCYLEWHRNDVFEG